MLLNPLSGDQRGFASLERLVVFLQKQMEEVAWAASEEQGD